MFINGYNNPKPITWECKACGGHTKCVLNLYNAEPLWPVCPLDIEKAEFKHIETEDKENTLNVSNDVQL